MMIFHKEGFFWLTIAIVDVIFLSLLTYFLFPDFLWLGIFFGLLIFVLIAQFFRNPVRKIKEYNDHLVYAPADGKIVVIEPVMENEFFKEERIQVSIFMSPLSTENERTSIVFGEGKNALLVRQIAGAVARRICCYVNVGQEVKQGEDFGFIKFGSRVDLFLPMDAKINVKIGEVSLGNKTIIATLN